MSYNLNIIYIICVLFQLEDWLEDSGWTNALVQANIASSGTGQHCQLWYRPTLPALVQANIASSGTGQHCLLWYRPTLPALVQANIASSGTGQYCQLWYRPTLPALVQANIASSGTADCFIRASHVTKTSHAHQVTAETLHTLLKWVYGKKTKKTSTSERGNP